MQERLSWEAVNRFLQKYEDDEHLEYSPALILKLRAYFWRLTKVDQREFLGAGVRCDLDREVLSRCAGQNLTNKKLCINHRLERPDILRQRLDKALLDPEYLLPTPAVRHVLSFNPKSLREHTRGSIGVEDAVRLGDMTAATFAGWIERMHELQAAAYGLK